MDSNKAISMHSLMSFVNSVVGGSPDPQPPQPSTPLLLPWEDYKEKALALRIKGSITDILRDSILEISEDERNFLIFSRGRDTDLYEFNFEEQVPLIMAVMEQDPALGKVFSRLVHRHTTEELFWKSYFYTVETVKDQTLLKFSQQKSVEIEESSKEKSDKHRELMDELESELSAEPSVVIKKEKRQAKEPIVLADLQSQLKAALARIDSLENRVEKLELERKSESQVASEPPQESEIPL